MKKLFFLLFMAIILFQFSSAAQNLLNPKCKFKTGDDLNWAKSEYDDKDWADISLGEVWENQGFKNYDGFAWYRSTIVFSSKIKKEAEKAGGFLLRIANIDDADYAYFNGEFIGKTGDIPPHYSGAYGVKREYKIQINKVKWDKPNVIAIRVFDNGGGGGIIGDPIDLYIIGQTEKFKMGPGFKEKDNILKTSNNIALPIMIENNLEEGYKGDLKVKLTNDFHQILLEHSKPVTVAKKSKQVINFAISSIPAGFYYVQAQFVNPANSANTRFGFGVEPEQISSPADPQPDFENYWARAKKELAAVDPQFKITKIDSLSNDKRDWYIVEMRSLGNVLVKGWYSVPKKEGKYPAILHVQGYSSFMIPAWMVQDENFISFGLNIRGHGFSTDNVNPGFPGYLQYFIQDKEQYIYRGAYMDCIRAVDFLCSRPEVDKEKIIVEGGSQGGALSFATAALDNERIKLCVPSVPFLSDFKHYFKIAAWPTNEFEALTSKGAVKWDVIYNTLSYIDIKNLAPMIKAPVFMGVGLVDDVCPPHINFAAYNNLKSEKEYVVYPTSGHGLPAEHFNAKMEWIYKKLEMTIIKK